MKSLILTTFVCIVALVVNQIYPEWEHKSIREEGAMKIINRDFLVDPSTFSIEKKTFTRGVDKDKFSVFGYLAITSDTKIPVKFNCEIDNRIKKISCGKVL